MSVETSVDFVEALRGSQVLPEAQMGEVVRLQAVFPLPRDLARELLRRSWLTAYQINQLFQGRGSHLVLGPYVLLERLGEGGMGVVFKARHQLMNRIVALKVIREERLTSRQAVERFQQEIQANAHLAHPNFVMAHDAGFVGTTHFLVMEYVPGVDLDKRLRQHGALPVAEACSYVRQVALGLQHAHERGLIHRDIKPSNLLVSAPEGVVKILDLGLARSRATLESDAPAGRITQEGSVMGSPDYLAPEQAVDSSKADIGADIYSLGCTFYHLLTGRPPFPGGTFAEKILKHQQAQPEPIAALRPGVPPELPRIVEKMMAKRKEDRYRTPGEVAAVLEAFGWGAASWSAPVAAIPVAAIPVVPAVMAAPLAQASTIDRIASSAVNTIVALPAADRPTIDRKRRSWLGPLAIGAGLSAVGAFILLMVILGRDAGPEERRDKERAADSDGASKKAPLEEDDAEEFEKKGAKKKPELMRPKPRPRPALKDTPGLLCELTGHTGPVQCLAFAPGGRTLASGGDDQRARLWSVPTGKKRAFPLRQNESVHALAWSRDGKKLATSAAGFEGAVTLWDPKDGSEVTVLRGTGGAGGFIQGNSRSLAFSDDGLMLASAGAALQLWRLKNDAAPIALKWEKNRSSIFYGVSFTPDGKTLVAGCHDQTGDSLRRWDTASGEQLSVIVGHKEAFAQGQSDSRSAVAFSPDGTILARVANTSSFPTLKTNMQSWDYGEMGKQVTERDTLDVPPGRVFAITIFSDGTVLVAVAQGKSRYPTGFQKETSTDEVQLWDSASKKTRSLKTGHRKPVISLAFSDDGRKLATGSDDATARVWDLSAAKDGKD